MARSSSFLHVKIPPLPTGKSDHFLVAFVLFSLGSWREEKAIDFLIIHSHLRLAKVNVGFRCASLGQLLAGSVEVELFVFFLEVKLFPDLTL